MGKLELATAAGLLTLHPEGTTLHGNVARPSGLEHVALPWPERGLVLVVGTPATAAAAARLLEPQIGVGEGRTLAGVSIGVELEVDAGDVPGRAGRRATMGVRRSRRQARARGRPR